MEAIINSFLLIGSILLLISIFLSKFSNKLGLPILILFLFVGIGAGSEGFGGIEYENYELTYALSLVAICIIIFSGGLSTNWQQVKPALKQGILLSTVGVILTTLAIAIICYLLFKISIIESLLTGAVLSSTDAAAVFSLFRDKKSQISKPIKSTLEIESGSNDPLAFFLVTLFLDIHQNPGQGWEHYTSILFINPIIGFMGGFIFFKIFKHLNNRIQLDSQGLYPAMTIGFLFLTYSATTLLKGNGLLAVYVLGLFLGNHRVMHKRSLLNYMDGTSWLVQIGLFVLLGLLVFPSRLADVAMESSILAVLMLIVARPISVYLCLLFTSLTNKEKFFISWAGLKGATPIVFASYVTNQLGSKAHFIFDIVFFSVLISALIQGFTINPLSRKLKLLDDSDEEDEMPFDVDVIDKMKTGIKQYKIKKNDFAINKRIIDLSLPKGTFISFIKRHNGFIIPHGGTIIEERDVVMVLTEKKDKADSVIAYFQIEQSSELENTK